MIINSKPPEFQDTELSLKIKILHAFTNEISKTNLSFASGNLEVIHTDLETSVLAVPYLLLILDLDKLDQSPFTVSLTYNKIKGEFNCIYFNQYETVKSKKHKLSTYKFLLEPYFLNAILHLEKTTKLKLGPCFSMEFTYVNQKTSAHSTFKRRAFFEEIKRLL
jgi:hypothetical protein